MKLTFRIITIILLLFYCENSFSQSKIWAVDFETGYSDNDLTAQDNNAPSGADWTKSGTPSNWWRVESDNVLNGSFSMNGRNLDGVMTWTSESITITNFSNVSISINLKEVNCETTDIIETFYDIGAGNVEFGDGNGNGNFNSATNTITGLSGTTLTITVTMNNGGGGERLIFDDIVVTGNYVGSGHALDFDGSNDYVSLGTSTILRPATNVSVEAWVYARSFGSWVAIFGNVYDSGSDEAGYGLVSNGGSGRVMFWVQTSGSSSNNYSSYPQFAMPLNTWTHVAGTYNGSVLKLYINGVEADSDNRTGAIDYVTSPLDARIGQYYDNNESQEFNGIVDELRIWSTARTQTQIRDNMCKKLAGTETGLVAYYRADESDGTNLDDLTSNGLDGTLNNMTNADWVVSGAALGDDSDHLYTNSWGGQVINISSTNSRGDFEVSSVSGTPTGVQVYRVDNVPNVTTGISPGLGTNDVYFGTFVVSGTSPTYTAEIDYTNYADAIADEPDLRMYHRTDNSGTSWSDITATVNAGTNTVTETSINTRRELILAGSVDPLPIELLSFEATLLNENTVELKWETASEINNNFFTIERSIDGEIWREVAIVTGAGNSSEKLQYTELDNEALQGISYYRLKQTDFDGRFDYSKVRAVLNDASIQKNRNIKIFPNPADNEITLVVSEGNIESFEIFDMNGGNVSSKVNHSQLGLPTNDLELDNLSSGFYIIIINQSTRLKFSKY